MCGALCFVGKCRWSVLVSCPDHTSHEENSLVNQVDFLGLEAHYGMYNHCIRNPAVLITCERVARLPCPVQVQITLISGEKMHTVCDLPLIPASGYP